MPHTEDNAAALTRTVETQDGADPMRASPVFL